MFTFATHADRLHCRSLDIRLFLLFSSLSSSSPSCAIHSSQSAVSRSLVQWFFLSSFFSTKSPPTLFSPRNCCFCCLVTGPSQCVGKYRVNENAMDKCILLSPHLISLKSQVFTVHLWMLTCIRTYSTHRTLDSYSYLWRWQEGRADSLAKVKREKRANKRKRQNHSPICLSYASVHLALPTLPLSPSSSSSPLLKY